MPFLVWASLSTRVKLSHLHSPTVCQKNVAHKVCVCCGVQHSRRFAAGLYIRTIYIFTCSEVPLPLATGCCDLCTVYACADAVVVVVAVPVVIWLLVWGWNFFAHRTQRYTATSKRKRTRARQTRAAIHAAGICRGDEVLCYFNGFRVRIVVFS